MSEADLYHEVADMLAGHEDTLTARKIIRHHAMKLEHDNPMPRRDQIMTCCALSIAIIAILLSAFH